MGLKRITLVLIVFFTVGAPSAFADEVPFSRNGQSLKRTEIQTENSVQIIDKHRSAGQGARKAADALWETMMSPDGAYYPAMINGLQLITGAGFLGWSFTLMWNWRKGRETNILSILQPLMVILMFQNNGLLMSGVVNGGRYVLVSMSDHIFDSSIGGVTGREAAIKAQNTNAYIEVRDTEIKKCQRVIDPDAHKTCLEQAEKVAKEYLKELTGDPGFVENISLAIENTVIDKGMSNDLFFISGVFFLILEYLLTFWGLLAPLFIAAHLLPRGQLGIKMMSAGYVGILTATLTYTVLSSACAIFLATAFAGNPTIYGYLVGIVNPFLSLGIGAMGISAGLAGTGQAISFGTRLLRRIA